MQPRVSCRLHSQPGNRGKVLTSRVTSLFRLIPQTTIPLYFQRRSFGSRSYQTNLSSRGLFSYNTWQFQKFWIPLSEQRQAFSTRNQSYMTHSHKLPPESSKSWHHHGSKASCPNSDNLATGSTRH